MPIIVLRLHPARHRLEHYSREADNQSASHQGRLYCVAVPVVLLHDDNALVHGASQNQAHPPTLTILRAFVFLGLRALILLLLLLLLLLHSHRHAALHCAKYTEFPRTTRWHDDESKK